MLENSGASPKGRGGSLKANLYAAGKFVSRAVPKPKPLPKAAPKPKTVGPVVNVMKKQMSHNDIVEQAIRDANL